MPHVNSSGGDDLASTDEVKVYKDEGEDEKRSSENLSDEKLGLLRESEEGKTSDIEGSSFSDEKTSTQPPPNAKGADNPFGVDRLGLPYPAITPYPLPNGALGHLAILQELSRSIPIEYTQSQGKLPSPGLSPFLTLYQNPDHFSPPPAHMGIPPVHIDPKTGFPRAMYSMPHSPGQFSHPFYQEWPGGPPGYPVTALRGPYPLSSSPLSRFSPPGLMHHPGFHLPHHAIVTPGPKQELSALINPESHRHPYFSHHPEGHHHHHQNGPPSPEPKSKQPRIKKPLNAFMLFMKQMRQQVIEECTLKESAAINQILGRRWHALDRSEQAKYYEMARKEKELHQQLYPGWSARDNYASHAKKAAKQQKRKRDMMANGENKGWGNENTHDSLDDDCPNAKKCRARFGLDQQSSWCKPCRRKKKCIRFKEDGGMNSNGEEEDDDDDHGSSEETAPSTTEGDSELGSPGPVPPPVSSSSSSSSSSSGAITGSSSSHGASEDRRTDASSSAVSLAPSGSSQVSPSIVPPLHPATHGSMDFHRGSVSALTLLPPPHPSMSAYPGLPPLYRPVPLRDGMLPPPPHHPHHPHHHHHGLLAPHPSLLAPQTASSLPPGPHGLPPPSTSGVASTMVLAT